MKSKLGGDKPLYSVGHMAAHTGQLMKAGTMAPPHSQQGPNYPRGQSLTSGLQMPHLMLREPWGHGEVWLGLVLAPQTPLLGEIHSGAPPSFVPCSLFS